MKTVTTVDILNFMNALHPVPYHLQTIGAEELAIILKKSVATIRRNASRSPHTLPPRIQTQAKKNGFVWRMATVQTWIEQQEKVTK